MPDTSNTTAVSHADQQQQAAPVPASCSACGSTDGPFSNRQLKKAAFGEPARCMKCIETDTPIKPRSNASNNGGSKADDQKKKEKMNHDDDAKLLEDELKEVRALVAGGKDTKKAAAKSGDNDDAASDAETGSNKRSREDTPKSSSSGHKNDGAAADMTFGNDETPTPLPRRKKRRDDASNGSLIKAMAAKAATLDDTPAAASAADANEKSKSPFFHDETDDDADAGGFSDAVEFDGDDNENNLGEDGGVSIAALKRQILGRKLITSPETPFSNHKETYLQADKVMMTTSIANGTSSSAANGNSGRSRYIIPPDLRRELNCPICHDTLYQPVSLTCGHSFCQECLSWWLERNAIPRNQRNNAEDANHGSCPTCRTPLPCDGKELNVNTSLRACVAALLGEELTDRVLAERRKRLAATRGERGGAHDSGYEVITPADEEAGWTNLGYKLTFRRSTVLDANDQRMQLALGLWGGPSGNEPLRFDGQRLEISICLMSMEEDEVTDGGFPRMVRDEDDEHLVCNENRFISTSVTAVAKSNDASSLPVGLQGVDEDGVATFNIDLTVGACRRAATLLFRHEETGAVFEIKVPRDDKSGDENDGPRESSFASNSKPRSYFRHDSDLSEHESENEFEDDGFVVLDDDDEEEEVQSEEEDEDDICCMCREHGELMICDGGDHLAGCGRSFHVACVGRVSVPDGDWVCKRCANAFEIGVGTEGYEFPAEGQGGQAGSAARPGGSPIHIESSNEDEEPTTKAAQGSKKTTKRRRVLEDSDDED